MRLLLPFAIVCLLSTPLLAQSNAQPPVTTVPVAPPPPPQPIDSPLAIPVPANARVRVDFDTRGDDLLGIMKNFLKGFNGDNIIGSLDATRAARAPQFGVAPQGPLAPSPALIRLAGEADLGLLLKDVNHVHLVVMEVPPGLPHPALHRTPGDLASPGLTAAAPQDRSQMMRFYEASFVGEGGHRILWADGDESARVLMVGFSRPQGYALVVQAPGAVVALRADGYPDPESIGPLLSLSAAQFDAAISEIMDALPKSMWPGH